MRVWKRSGKEIPPPCSGSAHPLTVSMVTCQSLCRKERFFQQSHTPLHNETDTFVGRRRSRAESVRADDPARSLRPLPLIKTHRAYTPTSACLRDRRASRRDRRASRSLLILPHQRKDRGEIQGKTVAVRPRRKGSSNEPELPPVLGKAIYPSPLRIYPHHAIFKENLICHSPCILSPLHIDHLLAAPDDAHYNPVSREVLEPFFGQVKLRPRDCLWARKRVGSPQPCGGGTFS